VGERREREQYVDRQAEPTQAYGYVEGPRVFGRGMDTVVHADILAGRPVSNMSE
jgi:hypothetical protein